MSFPRYPAYKDSGVEWLGEVPEHWRVLRLGQVGRLVKGNGGNKQDETDAGVPCIRYGDLYTVHQHCIRHARSFLTSERAVDYTPVQFGDVLFAASGETLEDIGTSAVNLIRGEVRCGGDVILLRPTEEIDPVFSGYALDNPYAAAQKAGMGRGFTVVHIYGLQLRNLAVPLPPLPEQVAIGFFLERETAKIDALVADYRALIELLQEKRQAVISHAVTEGLDPTVPMKHSGVEWLGKVPRHWDVVRLAELLREANDTGEEDLPILTVSIHHGVSDKEYDESELERKVTRSDDRSTYKTVRPGDLVYNMMRAWQGGFGAVIVDGLVSPAYVVARPIRQINTSFVEQVLRCPTAVEEMRRRSHGVTDFRLRLYWQEFKDIRIAIPPIEEQTETMRLVERQTEKFDNLLTDAQAAITLLQERRSALISAAVTGKIDVRGLVPEAPPVAVPDTNLANSHY